MMLMNFIKIKKVINYILEHKIYYNNYSMKKIYIKKNNVSYFEAGFRAALILSGIRRSVVDRIFYEELELPNKVRELLRKYDEKEEGEESLQHMENFIEKDLE